MGHYDNCRDGYCPKCGAAPGNIIGGQCGICHPQEAEVEPVVHPYIYEPAIRPFMQRRIDDLHAEINRLVAVEKAWADRKYPQPNKLLRTIRDARIEVAAWSPARKAQVVKEGGHA